MWTLENCRTIRRVTDPPQSGELGNHASPALWDMGGLFSRKIEHTKLEGSLGCEVENKRLRRKSGR